MDGLSYLWRVVGIDLNVLIVSGNCLLRKNIQMLRYNEAEEKSNDLSIYTY